MAKNKMMRCKTCGADIAKSADTCPSCGAKIKRRHPILGGLLLMIGLIVIIGVVSSIVSGEPKKVESSSERSAQENVSAALTASPDLIFTVGDTLEMQKVQVTLVEVRCNTGANYYTPDDGKVFLVFEFDIANNSTSDIAVSSLLSFKAYSDDYALKYSLSGELADGGRQLDGAVDAGKKMHGIIAFDAPEDWQTAEVRFAPNVWTGREFIFTVERSQAK